MLKTVVLLNNFV